MNTIGMLKPALLALALIPATVIAQKTPMPKLVTVKGKVMFDVPAGMPRKVWLSRENGLGKPDLVDSVELGQDLTYTFKIKQDHPGVYRLDVLHWDRIPFWSDGDVTVTSRGYDTSRYKMKIPHFYFVEGSSDNNFINLTELNSTNSYLRSIEEYNQEYYAKQHRQKTGDSAWITYLDTRPRYNTPNEDARMRRDALQKMYKDRPVLIYTLRPGGNPDDTALFNGTMRQLDRLLTLYPWMTEAKNMKTTITNNRLQAMKLKPGQPAPKVAYPDADGKLQGLEKYQGKYVLVDFWASWCGPCRQAIPKVKELYTQYKAKGLEVVSVSIDDNKKAWEKAMGEEKMPWEQLLSDNKEKTMQEFQFSGIPTLYLIDREGKIVTKYTGYSPEAEAGIRSFIEKGGAAKPAVERKSVPMTSM
ncbi:TlpA family protein disulfide reductase [Chitinophaga horti]|uniref:TlpA family protein disulfide reductase n=1 Tax=Chitinophaga horti TaxID=2920382 RepID=A0ABY6J741_9BACT|nr:TlpA disulfide reductase family protein [Chitinophaga horti]UYQ95458.1 TlpA family protein disulfide reductase [Chitinophaga horti]